jgi:CyaY protein
MSSALDDATFLRLSDECLTEYTSWLEEFDPDELDYTSTDGVLTLEFADGTRFVLNRQAGSRQMWYAAGARGWHYDWDPAEGVWKDDRDGHELNANVRRTVGARGRAINPATPGKSRPLPADANGRRRTSRSP